MATNLTVVEQDGDESSVLLCRSVLRRESHREPRCAAA
jgi:hypothetical protein